MSYLGHIVLNSRVTYGKNKKNVTYYAFKHHCIKTQDSTMIIPYKKDSKEDQTNVYVLASINENQSHTNHVIMTIQTIIGKVGTPQAEALYLQYKHNLRTIKKKQSVPPKNYFEQIITEETARRKKKEHYVYTIDPEGSSDHDDALSIAIHEENTTTTIGIHIADVSFLVSPNSELDKYAKQSLTSIYSNYLQPNNMLPSYICNDLMSLKENKPRLCVSIYYQYNKENKLINTTIARETLVVTKNCTYENVRKHLSKLQWNILTQLSNSNDTHKIVEYWMIKTNVLIAKKSKNNGILRVQEEPTITEFSEALTETVDIEFYKKMCSNKASYIIANKDTPTHHHSLQEDCYTHFTSPLRRYADIIAHRQLFSKNYEVSEDIINEINDINKRCMRLKSDEHKLQLIYDLEEQWKSDEPLLERAGTIMVIEEAYIYMHVEIKQKDYLLRVKNNKKVKKFQKIVLEIVPDINASIFSKKLKIKLINT